MYIIQTMKVLIFITIIKKIFLCFRKWDFAVSVLLSLGQEFFQTGDEETPNEAGLAYYDDLFQDMLDKGMEPVVTISHYEMPLHLVQKYEGWANRKLIDFYLRFCEVIFKRYKGKVKYWMTFNEINSVILMPEIAGVLDRTKDDFQTRSYQAAHHQFVASAKQSLWDIRLILKIKLDVWC